MSDADLAMPVAGAALIVGGLLLRGRRDARWLPWTLVLVGAVLVLYWALFLLGEGSGERGLHGILAWRLAPAALDWPGRVGADLPDARDEDPHRVPVSRRVVGDQGGAKAARRRTAARA
jgi:hypothetical protein